MSASILQRISSVSRVALVGIAASVATLLAAPADANQCTSASSCARYFTCPVGYSESTSRSGLTCTHQQSASTHTPTCGRHNNVSDWQWSPTKKKCHRFKKNNDVVYSTQNIECKAEHRYNGGTGKCEKPGSTKYHRPLISTTATPGVTPTGMCSGGADSCSATLGCATGYTKQSIGPMHYCKRSAPAATAQPTCSRHRSANDWKWSSGEKKCYRKKGKDAVYSTENIECPSDFGYNGRSGMCERAPETFYATPIAQ